MNSPKISLGTSYLVKSEDLNFAARFFRSEILGNSLLSYFKDNEELKDFPNKKLSLNRKLEIEQEWSFKDELPSELYLAPCIDFEASVNALSPKMTIGECLGVSQVIHKVFVRDGVLKCSKDKEELVPHSLKLLANKFLKEKKKFPLVFIGERFLDLDNKSEKTSDILLWGLREAISSSQKRFLVDGQYLEIDLESKNLKAEKHLKGAKELIVVRNVVSLSKIDEEGLVLRLEEAISESLIQDQFDMVSFGFHKESLKASKILSLSGSLICPKCFQVYLEKEDQKLKEKKTGDFVRGRGRALTPECYFDNLLESEFLEGKISDVLKSLENSTLKEEVTWLKEVFKDSFLVSRSLEDLISNFSQVEKIILYLEACTLRRVSGFYFILELVQEIISEHDLGNLVRAISRATNSGLSFFILSRTDFSQVVKFGKEDISLGGGISLVPFDLKKPKNTNKKGLICKPINKLSLEVKKHLSESLINIYGPVRSGKSEFLKDFVLEKTATSKKKVCKIYFSFQGDEIVYLSNTVEKDFKSFTSLEINYAEEFLLKSVVAKFYSDTRAAKVIGFSKNDFLNFKTSNFKCEECGGFGFLKSELALGYTGFKKCESCVQTGMSEKFKEVSFFDVSYFDLMQMSFREVFSLFEGDRKIKEAAEVFEIFGILDLPFNIWAFQCSKMEKIAFLMAKIVLFGEPGWVYLVENASLGLSHERFMFLKRKLDDTKFSIIFDSYEPIEGLNSNITTVEA
jgi:hypothetical protein